MVLWFSSLFGEHCNFVCNITLTPPSPTHTYTHRDQLQMNAKVRQRQQILGARVFFLYTTISTALILYMTLKSGLARWKALPLLQEKEKSITNDVITYISNTLPIGLPAQRRTISLLSHCTVPWQPIWPQCWA